MVLCDKMYSSYAQAHMLQAHMLRAIVTEWFVWVEAFALQSLIGTELKPGD